MRLAVGDGLMESLLGPKTEQSNGATPPEGDVVFSVRLLPGQISDLRAPFKLFEQPPPKQAPRWARYRRGRG